MAEDTILFPFNEEQWKIVLHYAPRVRELTVDYDELSVKILQSSWFRTTLLLPNLRRLHWAFWHTSIAPIRLLLGPSLVRLDVQIQGGLHTSLLAFLENYYTLCPNLKSLNFQYTPSTPEVIAAFSRAVCRASNLEALGCHPIDEAALIHVTQLPHLQEFNCSLLDYSPDDLNRLVACQHPPFANVRILDLSIQDLSTVLPFLTSACQPLEAVTFHFRSLSTASVFRDLFAALSSATRRNTLGEISLYTGYSVTLADGAPPQPIDLQVLSPLTNLHLRCLRLSIINPVSLNDDDIDRLVQAWPELGVLHLDNWECPTCIRTPTLRGLVLLLARCPKLHGLGLSLDATNVPSLSGAESLVRNTAVRRLSVGSSPIQEPVANVARFLHGCLPSLTAVEVYVGATRRMDYKRMWERVEKEIMEITPKYDIN